MLHKVKNGKDVIWSDGRIYTCNPDGITDLPCRIENQDITPLETEEEVPATDNPADLQTGIENQDITPLETAGDVKPGKRGRK